MSRERIIFIYEIDSERKKVVFPYCNFYKCKDFTFYKYVEGNTVKNIEQVYIEPHKELKLIRFRVDKPFVFLNRKIYANGFQTMTESRELTYIDRIKKLNPLAIRLRFNKHGDYRFYKNEGKRGRIFSHGFTYINDNNKEYKKDFHLIGSLNEVIGYTIFKSNTKKSTISFIKELDGFTINHKTKILDLFTSINTQEVAFNEYFKLLGMNRVSLKPSVGWTSIHNQDNITEEVILKNLNYLKKVNAPVDIVLVEDGYQDTIGDWLKVNNRFSRGMQRITTEIHQGGYKAGIWLAPFICEKSSRIYKNHPDWLVKNKLGRPIVIGYNKKWGGNLYSLDIYNVEFLDYLEKVFDTIFNNWKFDLVKLDYLYAAAIRPRNNKTSAMIMHDAMQIINRLTEGKLTIGSGLPLALAINNVDYCRISPKATPYWEHRFFKKLGYRERMSTKSALSSIISRRMYNQRGFVSVPNIFMISKDNSRLTQNEKYTLFQINNIFGDLILTADNIKKYDEESMRLFKSIFPKQSFNINEVIDYNDYYKVYFTLKNNKYILLTNLNDKEVTMYLDKGNYFCKETGEILQGDTDITLSSHQTKTYYQIDDKNELIATFGYVVPCGEIINVDLDNNKLNITIEDGFINKLDLFIKNNTVKEVFVNGEECYLLEDKGLYSKYHFEHAARLE